MHCRSFAAKRAKSSEDASYLSVRNPLSTTLKKILTLAPTLKNAFFEQFGLFKEKSFLRARLFTKRSAKDAFSTFAALRRAQYEVLNAT